MSKDNQQLDENEENSTLDETRESEETSEDLDELFDDSAETNGDETPEEKVKRLEEKMARIEKGVRKLATNQGREKVKEQQPKEEVQQTPTSSNNDDLQVLFYGQTPKAMLVEDDLKTIANAKYGGSILKAWNGESWIQDKASALSEAKAEEEKSKAKITKPSSDVEFNENISSVKAEDVASLKPSQKMEWIKAQAEKERNNG